MRCQAITELISFQNKAEHDPFNPLNPAYPDTAISGLKIIKGMGTHKRYPRSRKTVKFYVQQTTH